MYEADAGSISERYMSGANAGDLTIHPRREGAVEAIVEVSWSRGRVGHALLRLHSQFDGAARRGLKPDQLFGQLKALPEVRSALLQWAMGERLMEGGETVDAVLAWWLDRRCTACKGTQWITAEGKQKRPCTSCHGTGEARIPRGNEGRGMVAYMENCLHRHRASVNGRMAR